MLPDPMTQVVHLSLHLARLPTSRRVTELSLEQVLAELASYLRFRITTEPGAPGYLPDRHPFAEMPSSDKE